MQPNPTTDDKDSTTQPDSPVVLQHHIKRSELMELVEEQKTEIYQRGSCYVDKYLERVNVGALRQRRTMTSSIYEETTSPLKCKGLDELQFKLVEDGVDVASSSSDGDDDDNTSQQSGRYSTTEDPIMEQSSEEEQSPKMRRGSQRLGGLGPDERDGVEPDGTLLMINSSLQHADGGKDQDRGHKEGAARGDRDQETSHQFTSSGLQSPPYDGGKDSAQSVHTPQDLDLVRIGTLKEQAMNQTGIKEPAMQKGSNSSDSKVPRRSDAKEGQQAALSGEVSQSAAHAESLSKSPKQKRHQGISPKKSVRFRNSCQISSKSGRTKKSGRSGKPAPIPDVHAVGTTGLTTSEIMSLLTESEKNKIKRNVGDAFRKVLRQAEVKLILMKQPINRIEKEIDKLVEFLRMFPFLAKDKNLQYAEFRELAQSLIFKQFEEDHNIYEFGDVPQDFFIVLSGSVSHRVRNDVIDEWEWAHSIFEALLEWKKDVFDKRVKSEMQQHLDRIKRETDQRQLEKLQSMKPGKYSQNGDQVNEMIAGTHIKIMDKIRRDYFKSREQIQKEKEEAELQQKLEREREVERNEVMRFWKSHNRQQTKEFVESKRNSEKFDCERFVQLTPVERKNLIQIKKFKLFQWWVEKQKITGGGCFGQNAFEAQNIERARRKETMKTLDPTGVAVLNRNDYVRVLKKVEIKKDNCKSEYFLKVPFFQSFSSGQIRKLTRETEELKCRRDQYVMRQGDEASHVLVVQDGEFEILRYRKTNYQLIDPLTESKFQEALRLKNDQLLINLKDKRFDKRQPKFKTENISPKSSARMNNTLFKGERRQAGDIRIMIAAAGHMFGGEDISRCRPCTTSVRCISNTGTLITIKAEDFLNFLRKDDQVWDDFQSLADQHDKMCLGKIRDTRMTLKKLTGPISEVKSPKVSAGTRETSNKQRSARDSSFQAAPALGRQAQSQLNEQFGSLNRGHTALDDISDSDEDLPLHKDASDNHHKKHAKIDVNKTIDIRLSALTGHGKGHQNVQGFQAPLRQSMALSPQSKVFADKTNFLKLPDIQQNQVLSSCAAFESKNSRKHQNVGSTEVLVVLQENQSNPSKLQFVKHQQQNDLHKNRQDLLPSKMMSQPESAMTDHDPTTKYLQSQRHRIQGIIQNNFVTGKESLQQTYQRGLDHFHVSSGAPTKHFSNHISPPARPPLSHQALDHKDAALPMTAKRIKKIRPMNLSSHQVDLYSSMMTMNLVDFSKGGLHSQNSNVQSQMGKLDPAFELANRRAAQRNAILTRTSLPGQAKTDDRFGLIGSQIESDGQKARGSVQQNAAAKARRGYGQAGTLVRGNDHMKKQMRLRQRQVDTASMIGGHT